MWACKHITYLTTRALNQSVSQVGGSGQYTKIWVKERSDQKLRMIPLGVEPGPVDPLHVDLGVVVHLVETPVPGVAKHPGNIHVKPLDILIIKDRSLLVPFQS